MNTLPPAPTDEQRKELNEQIVIANNQLFDYIKNIILMESSLLAILISFHSTTPKTEEFHYNYCIILCLFGLSILGGLLSIYGYVTVNFKLYKELKEQYKKGDYDIITAKPNLGYNFCRKACVVFFFLAIGFLIHYAIVIDKFIPA